jgi:hypothetical protein
MERALKLADTRAKALIHRNVALRTRPGFIAWFAAEEFTREDSYSSLILLFIDHQPTLAVRLSVAKGGTTRRMTSPLRATVLVNMVVAGCRPSTPAMASRVAVAKPTIRVLARYVESTRWK